MFSLCTKELKLLLSKTPPTIMPCVYIFANSSIPDPKCLSNISTFQTMLNPTSTTLNPLINVESLNLKPSFSKPHNNHRTCHVYLFTFVKSSSSEIDSELSITNLFLNQWWMVNVVCLLLRDRSTHLISLVCLSAHNSSICVCIKLPLWILVALRRLVEWDDAPVTMHYQWLGGAQIRQPHKKQ